jgi:hypothetical protein
VADELRINVGVGGAKEAEAALKGVAGAEQAVGAAAQKGAAGAKNLGEGVKLGRQEITMLAMSLGDLGIQIPGLSLVLRTLLFGAINPVTLGITAAMLAAYGLASAVQASAAKEKEEKDRLERLAETYGKVAEAIETLLRKRRQLTFAGAVAAEKETFAVAAAGGLRDEQAVALLDAAAGTAVNAQEAAAAWNAPGIPDRAKKDFKTFVQWFGRQGPEGQKALAEAGAQAVRSVPSISARAARATGLEAKAAELTPQMRVEEEFAGWADMKPEEVSEIFAQAAIPGPGQIRMGARERIREFATAMKREPSLEEVKHVGPSPRAPGVTINAGVYYASPDSDPAGQIPRSTMR